MNYQTAIMIWNADLWLQVSSIILVFVSLLLAIFLFTAPSKNKTGNTFLGIYLLINAVDNASFFYRSFISLSPVPEMIRIDLGSFVKKPFLFFFVLSVLYSNFKLRRKHLLHFVPFLLNTVILMPGFYLADSAGKIRFFDDHMHSFEGSFNIVFSSAQFAFYIAAVFILLHRYKKVVLENYSQSGRINYLWLFRMNLFLLMIFTASTAQNVYRWVFTGDNITGYRLIMVWAQLVFICWLVLKAMYSPKIFSGIDASITPVSSYLAEDHVNKITPVEPSEELAGQITMLRAHMEKQEPYMDPDLTIRELALQIGMDTKAASLLINHALNQHFYDFVNSYRIAKAADMLKDPANKKMTVLEILYHVGFNSKSSFNTAFKKQIGYTPTDFRRLHQ
jgi:AraC-like DNA-binding protein